MDNLPGDLKYSKDHQWARDNGDGTVTVGITDHAQDQLGDLVYVELPDKGGQLETGQVCALVESVKSSSDVYAPVAGTVVAVNETLKETPETVNREAYGNGWLIQVIPVASNAFVHLMSAAEYEAFVESE
jgi:glycine cleavage system H protein